MPSTSGSSSTTSSAKRPSSFLMVRRLRLLRIILMRNLSYGLTRTRCSRSRFRCRRSQFPASCSSYPSLQPSASPQQHSFFSRFLDKHKRILLNIVSSLVYPIYTYILVDQCIPMTKKPCPFRSSLAGPSQ